MWPLNRLWDSLDRLPALVGVQAEWRAWLGNELEAVQPFLRLENDLSTVYPCPRPGGDGCPRRIVQHVDGSLVAVCGNEQPACDLVPLQRKDALAWRFDIARFANELAQLCGWRGPRGNAVALPGGFKLGTLTASTGVHVPVFLALPSTIPIERLLARQPPSPALFVVPRPDSLSAADNDLLTGQQWSAQYGVDLVLRDDQHRLVANDAMLAQLHEEITVGLSTLGKPFPTPAGSLWRDLIIEVLDADRVYVQVKDVARVLTCRQMGLATRRMPRMNRVPKKMKQWDLLRLLARYGGVLIWDNSGADRKWKKQIELLRRHLQAFFGIPGNPLRYEKQRKGWVACFTLRERSVAKLSAPLAHELAIANLMRNERDLSDPE